MSAQTLTQLLGDEDLPIVAPPTKTDADESGPELSDPTKAKSPDYVKKGEKRATKTKRAAGYTPLVFKYPKVQGGIYDFVTSPAEGSDDGWFPRGDPHLIGGPSGANKTTFIFDLFRTQFRGENFLGHKTYKLPYLVLTGDRGKGAHERTLNRMKIAPEDIPTVILPSVWGDEAIHAILDAIEAREVMPAVVFVEGCDMLVEDAAKMQIVTPFIAGLREIAEHYHIAIIGSVGSPKMRMGEGYASGRDKIFGTIAWSRKAETVVLIQYVDGNDVDCRRDLVVYLRNAAAEKYTLKMEKGRMVIDTETPETPATQGRTDIEWFRRQDDWFTVDDVMVGLNKAERTAFRIVKNAYAKHILKTKPPRTGEARQYKWNDRAKNPENCKAVESDGTEYGPEPMQRSL